MQGKACEEDMAEEWGVSLVEYCSEIRGGEDKKEPFSLHKTITELLKIRCEISLHQNGITKKIFIFACCFTR